LQRYIFVTLLGCREVDRRGVRIS